MSEFHRSGKPFHRNAATTAATLEKWPLPAQSIEVVFQNTHATETIELFMTAEAAALGAGYGFPVAVTQGFTMEVEFGAFWTLSTNVSSFAFVASCRG